MAKTFRIDIVTPEAVVYSGEADMVSARTTETTLLGHRVSSPIVTAPTAFHKLAHPDGEAASPGEMVAAHVVEVPAVGGHRSVEPHRVVEADAAELLR